MRAVCLLAVLATAVVSAAASDADWWQTALIYQIYPRSFKDSDGDGIGDLNGIRDKLSYLKETGVEAIWMSPIFLSPMYDFGYDITDYREIAPEYGTMTDFDNLMAEAKRIGIRIILDYVPNHTSNESEWFVKSKARESGYEDYYIWEDPIWDDETNTTHSPPNNWISIFRKSAWEWSEQRQQYYLHQFVIGQPDLNYRNSLVRQEMKDVISFWLEKGVSGFRVDAINIMYEVDKSLHGGKYPDEPPSGDPNADSESYEYLQHPYTKDQNETYDVVYDWRDLLNTFYASTGEYKIMMTEAYTDLDLMMKYYGSGDREGSIPFNFIFLSDLNNQSTARDIKQVIDKWMTYMPAGRTANWVNGNHDQSRLASRHGTDRVDAMNLLALILPGVTITYQGEEIGMTDGYISWEDTVDPQACNTGDPVNYWKKSRDPNRTPYHWDATANAGFSNTTGGTWLPVADNYRTLNLASQMAATKSHYTFYKEMAAVKKMTAVKQGDLDTRALSESLLVVTRSMPGANSVLGIVNLASSEEKVNLTSIKMLSSELSVVASGTACSLQSGVKVNKDSITVPGNCAIALETTAVCCNNSGVALYVDGWHLKILGAIVVNFIAKKFLGS